MAQRDAMDQILLAGRATFSLEGQSVHELYKKERKKN